MQLTVALCTYNPRPDLITRSIHSVVSQLGDLGDSVEFLIVDNNSDPPLRSADYIQGFPVEIIREPVPGLTAARETAIRRARGRVILFLDDDNILSGGYLKAVIEAFRDSRLGVLGGSIVPEYESSPPRWLSAFEPQLAIRRRPSTVALETAGLPYTDNFPIGAGFSMVREVALAYLADSATAGRIEGRKGAALSSGEDLDIDLFALSIGYKLKIDGALSLIHVIPARRLTEEYISELMISSLRSSSALDAKWRTRFGTPIFPYLHGSRVGALSRVAVFRLLSPLSAHYRVKRRLWTEISRLRARGEATSTMTTGSGGYR